jgi:hypothetical protein
MRNLINVLHRLTCLFATFLMSAALHTQAQAASRPAVVELFTSQGCSSCPPADALLGELARRPDVLALAFHVDYWDDLGWRDRFSLPAAVQRQRRYAQSLQLSTMFTPQAVINGRRSFVGTNRAGMVEFIDSEHDTVSVTASVIEGNLLIDLAARPAAPLDINVVAYLPEASTSIGRGENAGHVLHEFNVVRAFKPLGVWQGQAERRALSVSVLPQDATRVAVLVQQPDQGTIVGATVIKIR